MLEMTADILSQKQKHLQLLVCVAAHYEVLENNRYIMSIKLNALKATALFIEIFIIFIKINPRNEYKLDIEFYWMNQFKQVSEYNLCATCGLMEKSYQAPPQIISIPSFPQPHFNYPSPYVKRTVPFICLSPVLPLPPLPLIQPNSQSSCFKYCSSHLPSFSHSPLPHPLPPGDHTLFPRSVGEQPILSYFSQGWMHMLHV